jgi:hypothetical protein
MNVALAAAVLLPVFASLLPSDPQAVYAVLDQVVLLPNAEQPDSIELHGAFALAEGGRGQYYRAPRIGVLRLGPGKDRTAAIAQWRDLQALAGTGKVVTFGSRYEMLAADAKPWRVQEKTDAAPRELPAWSAGYGLDKPTNVDYGPARALGLLPRCLPVDIGKDRLPAEWPARSVAFSCTNCTAADADLRYQFVVDTSDGERFASELVAPGKGTTTWQTHLALQVGEQVSWTVHVVGKNVDRAPLAAGSFAVPASAVERK